MNLNIPQINVELSWDDNYGLYESAHELWIEEKTLYFDLYVSAERKEDRRFYDDEPQTEYSNVEIEVFNVTLYNGDSEEIEFDDDLIENIKNSVVWS